MNTSIQSKIFLIFIFSVWFTLCYFLNDFSPSNDAIHQLNQTVEGIYINWKPPIHSWVLMQFHNLAGDKMGALQCHYFAQLFLLGAGICLISYYLSQFRRIYVLSALVLCLLTPWSVKFNYVVNDAIFIGCLLSGLGIFLNTYQKNTRWIRYIGMGLAYSLFFFTLTFRLNSLPALFVIIFALAYMNKSSVMRAFVISGLLISSMIALQLFFHNSLGVKKGFPLNYLYVSDMQNVSILKGEWIDFYQSSQKTKEKTAQYPPQDIPLAAENLNLHKGPIYPYDNPTDAAHSQWLQNGWIENLQNNPREVLVCRLFAFQQFILGGRSLWFVNDWVKRTYPGTIIFQDKNHRRWRNYISISFFIFSGLTFCVAVSAIAAAIAFVRGRRLWLQDQGVRIAMILAAGGSVYILTFVPFTFSPTETRFYLPHSSCFAMSLSILTLYGVDRLKSLNSDQSLKNSISKLCLSLYQNSFLRYAFIGGFGFVIDFTTLYVLHTYYNIHYQISTACGFLLGLITVYLICNVWVFNKRQMKNTPVKEFIIFSLIGLIGLAFTHGLMWCFVEHAGWNISFAKMSTAILVLLWNFGARKVIIY